MLIFSYLDEIIRKRLLIDGEGAGDDRRITALLKTFLKWCNSTGTEEGDRLELFLLFFSNLLILIDPLVRLAWFERVFESFCSLFRSFHLRVFTQLLDFYLLKLTLIKQRGVCRLVEIGEILSVVNANLFRLFFRLYGNTGVSAGRLATKSLRYR